MTTRPKFLKFGVTGVLAVFAARRTTTSDLGNICTNTGRNQMPIRHKFIWTSKFRHSLRDVLLIMTMVVPLISFSTNAQDNSEDREADKSARVRSILSTKPMFQASPQSNQRYGKFCSKFLSDFRLQQNVEHIEPITRTNNPEDPAFERYNRCRTFEHPGGWAVEYFDSIKVDVGDKNFKLFRINLDGNRKNGLEEVIYGERDFDSCLNGCNASYSMINLKTCTRDASLSGTIRYDRTTKELISGQLSGLIRYKRKTYFYSLDQLDDQSHSPEFFLTLFPFSRSATAVCAGSTLSQPKTHPPH